MLQRLPERSIFDTIWFQLGDESTVTLDGQVTNELVRQAAERPLVTEDRSGLRVLRLNRRSPKVTTELVDRLREDLP